MRGRGRFFPDSSVSSDSSINSDDSFRTARNNSVDIFEFITDVFKYVDDTTVAEAIDLSNSKKHFTTNKTRTYCSSDYEEGGTNWHAHQLQENSAPTGVPSKRD